jgi:hypothetical protein
MAPPSVPCAVSSLVSDFVQQTVLRQANKLWPSDPLYLRKQLLIPLSACTLPPSNQVFEKVELFADEIRIYWRPLEKKTHQDTGVPSLIAARLDGMSDTGYSSRSASFDLMRMEADASLSRPSTPKDTLVDSFLANTNNIYATESVEDSAQAAFEPVVPRTSAPRKESGLQCKILPLVVLAPTPAAKKKDTLHIAKPAVTRSDSFHLSPQLSSIDSSTLIPPSPRDTGLSSPTMRRRASASPMPSPPSTPTRPEPPIETLALRPKSTSKKKSGWDAGDEEERLMAELLVRQVASKREKRRKGLGGLW